MWPCCTVAVWIHSVKHTEKPGASVSVCHAVPPFTPFSIAAWQDGLHLAMWQCTAGCQMQPCLGKDTVCACAAEAC